MIYTFDGLREAIGPVLAKYNIATAWLFGSYARGHATEDSDVDLLIDTSTSEISTLGELGLLYEDLSEVLGKEVDLITVKAIGAPTKKAGQIRFRQSIERERLVIYEAA